MLKVLFNATSFGYGPVSKAVSVIRKFINYGHECVFVGSGIAYEYVKREEICKTIYLDLYENEEDKLQLKELSKSFLYGITVMEPLFVEYCDPILKVGYIDSLFWMWDTDYFNKYHKLRNVDKYFAQNTFDVEKQFNKSLIKNFINTELIIDSLFLAKQSKLKLNPENKKLVIHFGGVENVYVPFKDIIFPFEMFKLLDEIIEGLNVFDKIIVISSKNTANKLNNMFKNNKYEFTSLSRKEFIDEIRNCQLLITTPGLTTLIEAFSLNIKTIFLMPQNYSQYLILSKLKELGYTLDLLNLDYFYNDFYIKDDETEELSIKYINKYLNIFFNDYSAQIKFKENLIKLVHKLLDNDYELNSIISNFQKKFIEKTGINGVDQIYNEILKGVDKI